MTMMMMIVIVNSGVIIITCQIKLFSYDQRQKKLITPREGMSEEQVTLLSFRERYFYLSDVIRAG